MLHANRFLPWPAIIGLNYFRTSSRGSGYFLLSYDVSEEGSYISGVHSSLKYYLNEVGTGLSSSGFWTGIATQDYASTGADEVIVPIDSNTLSGKYPIKRELLISGVTHYIDHYEPYKGWIYNYTGTPVAVNDYFKDYGISIVFSIMIITIISISFFIQFYIRSLVFK